jgi:hypothetical protein
MAPGVAALCVWGCVEQEPARPTEEDVKIIKQNILAQAPAMKHKVNADLEGKVVYLGLDVDRELIKPAEQFKLTHYWKVIKPVDDWEIFVHLNGPQKSSFINADHKAIGGRYPASRWKAGEIIRDEQTISLPGDWKEPKLFIHTGMWKGRLRMKVKGPQDDENRILAATLTVAVSAAAAQAAAPKRLVATRAKKAPKIDGKLDDEVWAKAASTGSFVDTLTGGAAGFRTEAKVAWDDSFLYVAFQNQDDDVWSTLKKRDDKLWTQEVVEVFIDANGDGKDYIELQVNPHNAVFDSYLPKHRDNQNDWNSKLKSAVVVEGTLDKRDDRDKGWTVEIAIPWADTKGRGDYELKLPPAVGDTWRINLFRMELPKNKPQLAGAWSPPLIGDFHKLDRFGQLVFGDEEGKAPEKKAEPKKEEKKAEAKTDPEPTAGNVVRMATPAKVSVRALTTPTRIDPSLGKQAKKAAGKKSE